MKYPLPKLLNNFKNMGKAEILLYLKNQKKELEEGLELLEREQNIWYVEENQGRINEIKEMLKE